LVWAKPETKPFKVFQKLPNRLKSGSVQFKPRVNRLRKSLKKFGLQFGLNRNQTETKPKLQVWFQFDHPDWFWTWFAC